MLFLAVILLVQAVSFGSAATEVPCDPLYVICGKGACAQPTTQFNVQGDLYEYSDFSAISFGDFNIDQGGDVQGRTAVEGDFTVSTNGASFGDLISTTSSHQYGLIVGGNVDWTTSGGVKPAGFAGGAVSAPAYISNKFTVQNAGASALSSTFSDMNTYFTTTSQHLSGTSDNVNSASVSGGVYNIDCTGVTADVYFSTVTVSDFNTVMSYSVTNCPAAATFVINIQGGGAVTFQGAAFTFPTVVFNLFTASTVSVMASVTGSILAPNSKFTQMTSTLTGQVVASKFEDMNQINLPGGCGGMHGDPLIIGFHGEKFWFHGHVDGIFNIYNDEYVNVNSIFGKATEARGTIMRVIGVEIGGHQISFGVHEQHSQHKMSISLDGRDAIATSDKVLHLDGCVEVAVKKGSLIIRSPTHDIKIIPKDPKSTRHAEEGHIDRDYLDFVITTPKDDVAHLVGGVIGQTASRKQETAESLFLVGDLYSADKSTFYKAKAYQC